MVWACVVQTKQYAFCAEMNVRFLKPLKPGVDTLITGELAANRKGRIFEAKSALLDLDGNKFAKGTGKYLPIKDTDAQEMMRDLIEPAS